MKKNKLEPYISILKKPVVLFLIFTIIGSVIFFLRFPNNFTQPNFYAEDGSIFLTNIQERGFLGALFTSFNGYFIFGLYLMEGVGFLINFIAHKDFIDLASSFAITSYIFFGAVAALPFLLFKKVFNFSALLITFLLITFVPLPGSDYAILGTIGNAKFAFVYIAFLILIYRHITPEKSWRRIVVADLFIALCAYTNIVVYPLLLFALIRYIPIIKKSGVWYLLKLHSFQSLMALGVVLIPQLIYIKINGIPAMPGYLDTPYEPASTINLFIYRPFLFPFLDMSIKSMSNTTVIVAFITLITMLWFGLKKWWAILVFGVVSIFLITLLFVINRTGVSSLFLGYASGGPDQFFYTQNMIICFLFGIAIFELIRRVTYTRIRRLLWLTLAILIWFVYIPASGTFGKNDFMQKTVGNIYTNAQKECSETNAINIQLYPIESTSFQLKNQDRKEVCTSEVINYVPSSDDLGLKNDSTYISSVSQSKIQQTFKANYNGLNGIGVQFLTYKTKVSGEYTLDLYDKTCTQKIRTSTIDGSSIQDAQFSRYSFDKIANSKGKVYCYTIVAQNTKGTSLAVSLSKPDEYSEGTLTINASPRQNDLMMELYYAR